MAMNPGLAAYIASKNNGSGKSNLKDAAQAKLAPSKSKKPNPFAAAAAAKIGK